MTDSNQLIGDLDGASTPPEPFKYALHALFKVEGAQVYAWNVSFRGETFDHADSEVHAVVLDLLVVVLQKCQNPYV